MVKRKKTTLIGDGCRPNIQVTFLVLLLSCLFSLEHEAAGPHIDFGPICPPPIVRPLVILFFIYSSPFFLFLLLVASSYFTYTSRWFLWPWREGKERKEKRKSVGESNWREERKVWPSVDSVRDKNTRADEFMTGQLTRTHTHTEKGERNWWIDRRGRPWVGSK